MDLETPVMMHRSRDTIPHPLPSWEEGVYIKWSEITTDIRTKAGPFNSSYVQASNVNSSYVPH